jgi:hypothetical protein
VSLGLLLRARGRTTKYKSLQLVRDLYPVSACGQISVMSAIYVLLHSWLAEFRSTVPGAGSAMNECRAAGTADGCVAKDAQFVLGKARPLISLALPAVV